MINGSRILYQSFLGYYFEIKRYIHLKSTYVLLPAILKEHCYYHYHPNND